MVQRDKLGCKLGMCLEMVKTLRLLRSGTVGRAVLAHVSCHRSPPVQNWGGRIFRAASAAHVPQPPWGCSRWHVLSLSPQFWEFPCTEWCFSQLLNSLSGEKSQR